MKSFQQFNEVAPPGWGHTKAEKEKTDPSKPKSKIGGTIAAMKRAQDRGDIPKKLNIFALAYSMKNKGAKPHYKPGTDEKYKKYQEEVKASYSSDGTVTFGQFYNRAKEAMKNSKAREERARKAKERNAAVRADSQKHGIKFSDVKGTGRIVKGKKVYD